MTEVTPLPAAGLGSGSRRASWTLADQAVSSLSNSGLSIIVARSVTPREFGSFSVVFLVFTFAIGLSRTLVTDPLVIRHSASGPAEHKLAAQQATGAAVGLGLIGSGVCAVAALLLSGSLSSGLVALAVVLPLLLVQDTWRYTFFSASRPAAATSNDLVWTVLQFVSLGALIAMGQDTVVHLILAWGISGGIAAIVGCWQGGALPHLGSASHWLRTHHQLSSRLAADYVIGTSAVNIALLLVGSILGIAAVGALRAAQLLLGPLQLLMSGATAFILPVFSRRVAGGDALLRPAVLASAALTPISLAWVALLLLLPDTAGEQLLGETWAPARELLPALGTMMVLISMVVGAGLALKSMARSGLLLKVTLVQAPLIVLLTWAGALMGGTPGAAAGLAAAHLAGLSLTWLAFWRSSDPH